jgi:hypothetical protein
MFKMAVMKYNSVDIVIVHVDMSLVKIQSLYSKCSHLYANI